MIRIPHQSQMSADAERGQCARFGARRQAPAIDCHNPQDWSGPRLRAGLFMIVSPDLAGASAPVLSHSYRVGAILLPAFPRRRLVALPVVSRRKFHRALCPQAGGRGAFNRSPAFRGHSFVNSQVCEQAAKHLADLDHQSLSTRVIPAAPRSSGKGTRKIGKADQQEAA